ncbi:MAG: hypothetical protein FJZ04_01050 [Candidatus Moranbacteria bacterium]|nr:hypothetical protein [Candidatus Moranbacteria bacterium]
MQEKHINSRIKPAVALILNGALAVSFVFLCLAKETQAENSNSNANKNSNQNANANDNQNSNSNSDQNALRYENLEESLSEKMKDLSEVEAKIESYNKLIEIKQDQQKTLANQIVVIDNQIEKNKEEVIKAERKIELYDLEIQNLEMQINEKKEQIAKKKAALQILLNDLYRKENKNPLEILLSYPGFSSFIQEVAYGEQVNQRVFNKLQEIDKLRKDLEDRQKTETQKKKDLENAKQEKLEKTYYLEGEQSSKEQLLEVTQGEEGRYQELLERVETQKQTLLGDIEELSASKSGELNIVQSHQKKPASGLASTDWYFSQRDSRWGGRDIGHSNTKMKSYGCAVTSVAMVLKYHGVSIDPGVLARQPIFSYDLIVWPEYWQNVKRSGGHNHGNIDWDTVDDEIANHNPVIVFVKASCRGAGHYVVIHHKDNDGQYVVHDPIWGPNIFLTSTKENVAVLYGCKTVVDQMIIYHNTKRSGESSPENANTNKSDANKNNNLNDNSNSNNNSNKNENKNKNKNKN